MLKILIFLLAYHISFYALGQEDTSLNISSKNAFFAEIGGAGIYYSPFNYERKLIDNKKIELWGRIGLSLIPQRDAAFILSLKDFKPEIPFGFSIVYKNRKHDISFEQSVFMNFLLFEVKKYNSRTYYNYGLYAGMQLIGFRVQNNSKKLYFKAGMGFMGNLYELYFNDIIIGKQNEFLRLTRTNLSMMLKFSIGYNFKSKN